MKGDKIIRYKLLDECIDGNLDCLKDLVLNSGVDLDKKHSYSYFEEDEYYIEKNLLESSLRDIFEKKDTVLYSRVVNKLKNIYSNSPSKCSYTSTLDMLLRIAVEERCEDIITFLLSLDCDYRLLNETFFAAIRNNNLLVVTSLIEKGFDIEGMLGDKSIRGIILYNYFDKCSKSMRNFLFDYMYQLITYAT